MVSFDLTPEQRLLADTASTFARDRIRPAAREADESGDLPFQLVDTAWQIGFIQASIPESYQGFGGPRAALNGALFAEQLAWGDLSLAMAALSPALVAFPLLSNGTDDQKSELLPRFTGDSFPYATAALLEPCYQFDPQHLTTSARAEGNAFVLNGKKCFVPLADQAGLLLVYAQDSTSGGPQGFLLERGTAGLHVGEREKNMGIKALPSYELSLVDCRVPAARRLGGSSGCDYASILDYSRIALAAMAVGLARGAFEYARDYAKDRHQFGEPVASRQAIAFMLADMAIDVDASRLMVWEAAWKLDRGQQATREVYLAKLYADDMVLKVSDGAVQTLGGHGYIREHPVEMWLRNARGFATFDGLATV